MILVNVRFSYAHVFEPSETPSGDMKYSACIMIPKDNTAALKEYQEGVAKAVAKGIEKNKITKAQVKSLRMPLRDGDEEHASGDRGAEFKGFFFMNAGRGEKKGAPGVVGPTAKPIMEQDDFYSGCWGNADVNFFAYNTAGNRGIGVGLNNVMKVKDDERLDGKQKAEDAFAAFAAPETEGDVETATGSDEVF